jgi:hypothetical protein
MIKASGMPEAAPAAVATADHRGTEKGAGKGSNRDAELLLADSGMDQAEMSKMRSTDDNTRGRDLPGWIKSSPEPWARPEIPEQQDYVMLIPKQNQPPVKLR